MEGLVHGAAALVAARALETIRGIAHTPVEQAILQAL